MLVQGSCRFWWSSGKLLMLGSLLLLKWPLQAQNQSPWGSKHSEWLQVSLGVMVSFDLMSGSGKVSKKEKKNPHP